MDTQHTALLHLLAALFLANLPFLLPARAGRPRPAGRDLALCCACYALWSALGLALEGSVGTSGANGWQIWAVTAALFAVCAFPGVVARYLLRIRPYPETGKE